MSITYNIPEPRRFNTNLYDTDINIARVTLACRVPTGAGAKGLRRRATHALVFIYSGKCVCRFASGETREIAAGRLFYLPKGSRCELDGDFCCGVVSFELDDPDAAFPYFESPPERGAPFEPKFAAAEAAWSSGLPGSELAARAELYAIIALLRSVSAPNPSDARLAESERRLRSRIGDPSLRVSELARLAGVTPEWYRAEFRRAYGASPAEYVSALRIERAKELLGSGMFTVAGTAEACGYASSAYFCREFKRRTGATPGEYMSDKT